MLLPCRSRGTRGEPSASRRAVNGGTGRRPWVGATMRVGDGASPRRHLDRRTRVRPRSALQVCPPGRPSSRGRIRSGPGKRMPGETPGPVFWLRTVFSKSAECQGLGAESRNQPLRPFALRAFPGSAFPPHVSWGSDTIRTTYVLYSGASAADFHRLPVAAGVARRRRRALQPPGGEGNLAESVVGCEVGKVVASSQSPVVIHPQRLHSRGTARLGL
jgi:hypothetical protein